MLAVVTAGLYLGWHAQDLFAAETRLNAQAFWEVLVFALNIDPLHPARPPGPARCWSVSASS